MAAHKLVEKFYPESQLLGYTFVDGTAAFYNAVNKLIGAKALEKTILDLGCGRGWYMYLDESSPDALIRQYRNFKGRVKKVIGIDVDKNAETNPAIDEFRIMEIDKPWPVEDESIDVCICDYVMEHVENVSFFFAELRRVLKKGGIACLRTPNKFGYMALVSSLVPNSMHSKLLKKIQPNRNEQDIFPVVYKCNTKKAFRKNLQEYGFDPYVYSYEAEPSYLRFSYISFALGFYLSKLLPKTFKATIFAFGRKK